jgi:hypothetical protein
LAAWCLRIALNLRHRNQETFSPPYRPRQGGSPIPYKLLFKNMKFAVCPDIRSQPMAFSAGFP